MELPVKKTTVYSLDLGFVGDGTTSPFLFLIIFCLGIVLSAAFGALAQGDQVDRGLLHCLPGSGIEKAAAV